MRRAYVVERAGGSLLLLARVAALLGRRRSAFGYRPANGGFAHSGLRPGGHGVAAAGTLAGGALRGAERLVAKRHRRSDSLGYLFRGGGLFSVCRHATHFPIGRRRVDGHGAGGAESEPALPAIDGHDGGGFLCLSGGAPLLHGAVSREPGLG